MKWIPALALLCVVGTGASARKKSPPPKRPEAAKPAPVAASPPPRNQPPRAVPVETARSSGGRDAVQRESKIEFDERLVQGQTASGAIYLFQRGESEFNSMVRLPSSFRARTVETVLGDKR